jgi:hypothetical protein
MIGAMGRCAAGLAVLAWSVPAAAQTLLTDPAALLAQADRNRDGSVSRAEFIATRAGQFDSIDTNGDGGLAVGELAALARGQAERMAIRLGFGQFDTNRDGRVSRGEFDAGPTLAFDRIDADRNGVASAREIEAARSRS